VLAVGRDFVRMQDYIVGRLSDDERRAFEDRLLRDPQLVRELEQSLRMREGLQQLRGQGCVATAASRGKVASRGRSLRLWLPALAAAAIAGLALFLWVQRGASPVLTASLESGSGAHDAPFVTGPFTFVPMRGGLTPDVDLPSAGLIEFRAAPAMRLTGPRYRVTLMRRDPGGSDEPVGALAGLALSSDGYVHCFADASRLTQGSYLLRIAPDTTTNAIAEFQFNLRASRTELSP
jgi:hypothetical protein